MTKQEEQFFIDLFLNYYNKSNNTNFEVITRPENDQRVNGTYDYLCCDKDSTVTSLAIELTGLHKSESNVEINRHLGKLVFKFMQSLRNEGLNPAERYWFQVKFKNAPKSEKDKSFYATEMLKLVKQSLEQRKLGTITTPSKLSTRNLPLIKEFILRILSEGNPDITLSWTAVDNESFDILTETLASLIYTLDDNNPKLGIPKSENKKTILLIINSWILVDDYTILTPYKELPQEKFSNIDEIYFINQKSFSEEYNILKLK